MGDIDRGQSIDRSGAISRELKQRVRARVRVETEGEEDSEGDALTQGET